MSKTNEMYLKEIDFMTVSDEELKTFTDNARMNVNCAKGIKAAVAENYGKVKQWCLDVQGVMDSVLSEYEPSRVAFCLATVIDNQNYDGRYSHANKEWAKGIRESLPKMYGEKSDIARSVIGKLSETHQVLIDAVATEFRKQFPEITSLEHKEEPVIKELTELYLKECNFHDASAEEKTEYFDNARMNQSCAKAIKNAMDSSYDGSTLNTEDLLDKVFSEYEPSRTAYCLAVAVNNVRESNPNISAETREWADSICESLPEQYKTGTQAENITIYLRPEEAGLLNLTAKAFKEAYPEITHLNHKEPEHEENTKAEREI